MKKSLIFCNLFILLLSSCTRQADPPQPQQNSAFIEYNINGKHFEVKGAGITFLKDGSFNYLLSAQNNSNDNDPNNAGITFTVPVDSLQVRSYTLNYFFIGYSPDEFIADDTHKVSLVINKYQSGITSGTFTGTLINGNGDAGLLTGDFQNVQITYK
jgi:hypothetical protein